MTQTITASGTDCFALAAQYLGDPNQFYRILAQNLLLLSTDGVADPVISGTPITIVIPDPETAPTGGIPTL
jgi:hypothetical protein